MASIFGGITVNVEMDDRLEEYQKRLIGHQKAFGDGVLLEVLSSRFNVNKPSVWDFINSAPGFVDDEDDKNKITIRVYPTELFTRFLERLDKIASHDAGEGL